MPRPDSAILRPSSHFKKLTYEQVRVILNLMDEVNASTDPSDRLDEHELDARAALDEIRVAMEEKRAKEDQFKKDQRRTRKVLQHT